MHLIGVLVVLTGLLFGIHALPSSLTKRHISVRHKGTSLNHQHDLKSSWKADLLQPRERGPRDIRMLHLHDPLDCLSQVVCGLNTSPPQKPSVRSSSANDFAFLLKNAVTKLRSQKLPTTTTTTAPTTKRTSTTKAPLDDDDDEEEDDGEYYDDTVENDDDDEDDNNYEDRYRAVGREKIRHRVKRYSIFNKRRGGNSHIKLTTAKKKGKIGKSTVKKLKVSNKKQIFKKVKSLPPLFPLYGPRQLTPLDRLRMETDLRAKLLSDAQCVNGLNDHTCPFNYQQMLVLMSSSLERERTISYSTNKILPMVGYLLKSRNHTGALQATFTAIERINNYTIEADQEGRPVDFTHILDEVMNRVTGDNGLRIVDTSNDSGSASVWEDDEFDHVLQNPYERKKPQADNYKLPKKKKDEAKKQNNQAKVPEDDQSTTSEEDTSEEGLVFDRPRPAGPSHNNNGPGDGDSSSEEDDKNQAGNTNTKKNAGTKEKKKITGTGFDKQSMVPGPVFGFSHLQKSAEDE